MNLGFHFQTIFEDSNKQNTHWYLLSVPLKCGDMLELAIIFQIVSDGSKGLLSFLNLLFTLINAKCKNTQFCWTPVCNFCQCHNWIILVFAERVELWHKAVTFHLYGALVTRSSHLLFIIKSPWTFINPTYGFISNSKILYLLDNCSYERPIQNQEPRFQQTNSIPVFKYLQSSDEE